MSIASCDEASPPFLPTLFGYLVVEATRECRSPIRRLQQKNANELLRQFWRLMHCVVLDNSFRPDHCARIQALLPLRSNAHWILGWSGSPFNNVRLHGKRHGASRQSPTVSFISGCRSSLHGLHDQGRLDKRAKSSYSDVGDFSQLPWVIDQPR